MTQTTDTAIALPADLSSLVVGQVYLVPCRHGVPSKTEQVFDFGVVDGKGRTVGAVAVVMHYGVEMSEMICGEGQGDGRWFHSGNSGFWFPLSQVAATDADVIVTVSVQATRAGVEFGASQYRDVMGVDSEETRALVDALVVKKVNASRKRAQRNKRFEAKTIVA